MRDEHSKGGWVDEHQRQRQIALQSVALRTNRQPSSQPGLQNPTLIPILNPNTLIESPRLRSLAGSACTFSLTCRRLKSDTSYPCSSAALLMTVAGSCTGSPTRYTCRQAHTVPGGRQTGRQADRQLVLLDTQGVVPSMTTAPKQGNAWCYERAQEASAPA